MLLSAAFELYRVDYIAMRGLSRSTEENYELAVQSFKKAIEDIEVSLLSPQHILVWRRWMEKRNKPGTIRGNMSKLKNILIFTNKKGITSFDISEIFLPKLPPPLPEYLLPEEVGAIIHACVNIRDKLIVSMMFCSGMRAGELCRLDKTDIVGNQIYIRQGKCNTSRMVFIDQRTQLLMQEYIRQRTDRQPQVFYSHKKGRLQTETINKLIKQAAKLAHIAKPVHSHMLRHSFATTMVREGVDISYVQRMMGHAFVSTTQIYIHLSNSDLQGAHAKVFG